MSVVQCCKMAIDGPPVDSAGRPDCPAPVRMKVTVGVYSVLVTALLFQCKSHCFNYIHVITSINCKVFVSG